MELPIMLMVGNNSLNKTGIKLEWFERDVQIEVSKKQGEIYNKGGRIITIFVKHFNDELSLNTIQILSYT
jgi:hypothetical protein